MGQTYQNFYNYQQKQNQYAQTSYAQPPYLPPSQVPNEIPPASVMPDDQIDMSPTQDPSWWERLDRSAKKEWRSLQDIAADTIHTKPWSEMTPEEKRQAYARWHREMKNSHIPKWARKAQKWITYLDNIEDATSSAAALARLGAFVFPEAAPILMPISGALDLTSLALDIPKDLLSVPMGPQGWKSAGEDATKLIHPKKTLKALLEKEAPESLKEALPSLGELMEMAQVADTLFHRGLCLGPIMGKISDLWFSGLEKIGLIHEQKPHDDYPEKMPSKVYHHRKPKAWVPREMKETERGTGPRRLRYLRIPQTKHSPISFQEIPIHVDGIFTQPNPMEFLALKTWDYAYNVLLHPGGLDEELSYKAVVAHTLTFPWAWSWLWKNEWWKIAAKIGGTKPTPELIWPGGSAEYLKEQGLDPYEPQLELLPDGNEPETYDDYISKGSSFVGYRVWAMQQRHLGTKQGFVLHTCISYLSEAYVHALNTDPLEPSPDGSSYIKRSKADMKPDLRALLIKLLGQYKIYLPPDCSNKDWHKLLDRFWGYVKANGEYPDKQTLCRWVPEGSKGCN